MTQVGRTDAVVRALLGTARSPGVRDPAVAAAARTAPPERLLEGARHHRLEAALAWQLQGADGLPDRLGGELRSAYLAQAAHRLRVEADLRTVAAGLRRAGARWVTFKGLVLAETAYATSPEVRSFADLDVMVEPGSVPAAVTELLAAGAAPPTTPWDFLRRHDIRQLSLQLPLGTSLDLHWDLFSLPFARRAFPWPVAEVFAHPRTVQMAGAPVDTLDVEDTLLHLCVHAALSGASQLARLQDVLVVCRQPVRWDVLVDRARQRSLGLVTAAVLARAARLLGATVTEPVLDALHPASGLRTALAAADRWRSPAEARSGHWTLDAVYRSLRGSSRATAAQIGRVAVVRAVGPLGAAPPGGRVKAWAGELDELGLGAPPDSAQDLVRHLRRDLPSNA